MMRRRPSYLEASQASSSSPSRSTGNSNGYCNRNVSRRSVTTLTENEEEEVSSGGRWCVPIFFRSYRRRSRENPSSQFQTGSNNFFLPGRDSNASSYTMESTTSSRSGSDYKCGEGNNFSMKEIRKATGSFAAGNIIGQGRFGTVYKGKLRDGTIIAVKSANKSTSNNSMLSTFKNEIQTMSKIQHMNLVRCFGFLEQGGETFIILEYVGNGNLREHLDLSRGAVLETAARVEIAIDVAHAITYLHSYADHPIIHRDIKSSNILVTENLRAKVSDFGLAHLIPEDPNVTHISTTVQGTAGYMDPEYIKTNQLTEKSDVYSFGVLLVELVTGRYPVENHRQSVERITARWAMQRFKVGDSVVVMDPRLRRNPASVTAVEGLLGLAHKCLASSRKARPSMKQCGETLWRIRKRFKDNQ